MKKTIVIICSIAAALAFTGCVATTSPASYTVTPTGVTNYTPAVYAPSASLSNIAAQANSAAPVVSAVAAMTPAAPVAPLIPSAVGAVFGLLTLISTGVAAWKNSQANAAAALANSHANAAAALAAAVTSLNSPTVPAVQTALQMAAQNNSSGAVAVHLTSAVNPVQTEIAPVAQI